MIEYILIFWAIFIVGFSVAYVVSEHLVIPFGLFDVYPWKCRKCMTTWTLIALYASVALAMSNWILFICGVLITAAQTLCIIITDKEKGL